MTATPTPPPPEPAAPVPTVPTVPTQAVPYGPPATESGGVGSGGGVSIDLTRQSVAGTAGKWAIRLLIPIVIRAIFRAIFR